MPSEWELKNGLIRTWGSIPFSQHLLTIKKKGLKQKGPMTYQKKWEVMKDGGGCFLIRLEKTIIMCFA